MCYPYHRQASLTFDREMGDFCPSNVELGKTLSTYFKLSIIAEFGLFVPLTKLLIQTDHAIILMTSSISETFNLLTCIPMDFADKIIFKKNLEHKTLDYKF